MDEVSLLRVLQGVGQAGAEPANCLNVRGARQEAPSRAIRRHRRQIARCCAIERLQQIVSRAPAGRQIPQDGKDPGQRGAAEIGHAQRAQIALRMILHAVERHNVRVLHAAEREMFAPVLRRHLHHHGAPGQRRLRRQENPATAAAPQFLLQLKITEHFTRIGKSVRRRRLFEQLMAIQQDLKLGAPLGKALQNVRRGKGLAVFPAQANLFVNQLNRGFRLSTQLRMPFQVFFGKRPLPPAPAFDHVLGQPLRQRKRAAWLAGTRRGRYRCSGRFADLKRGRAHRSFSADAVIDIPVTRSSS